MGVVKRGKFYWYEFVFNAKRVRKSTKQSDKETAKKLMAAERSRLARVDAGLESGEPKPKQKNLTIGELLDGLEEHYGREGKASAKNLSTIRNARRAFGATMAAALTPEHIEGYIKKRLAAGARPATINRITEVVRRAFKVAKHPVTDIRHLSERGNERKGFFSVQELEKVVANLPADLRDFTRFAFATAWRKGEIASLRWSDVEEGIVRLRGEHSKNRESRQVVIDGEITGIIERRQQARGVETSDGMSLSEYVFHRDGEPVREFRKTWATACEKAGVRRLFYDLRRSGVRDMIRSGIPQSVAMKISGHKTASMFRRYDIASEADLRSAMLNLQKYREAERRKVVPIAGQ